ncbi:MAG TPA: hypothetical protein VJ892_03260 [Candidatus Absconditabacterales bacterium]|nr:hypothetical protein [Candidatus Absconditabacterales bacterium]
MAISTESIEKEILKTQKNEDKKEKNIGEDLSKIFIKTKKRFGKNKDKVKILIPIAIISSLIMFYMITKTVINIKELNKESSELYNLNNFNIKLLENNEYTKNQVEEMKTVNELINYEIDIENEIERYNGYLSSLQNPYTNLTKHLLLPQLNIWKDPFLGNVDTTILGAKFLEKNPYDDIKLIQEWSEFFKNVGNNNEFNQIEDITIGEIVEEKTNFYIPIKINFISSSKRSFLLLVEKLSITSNQLNISLINEFIYHIRNNIKEEKNDTIEELKNEYGENFDTEKIIGYHIYQRINNNGDNKLINDDIIKKSIEQTAICNNEVDEYCYYKFRDKYRSIPSLAYTIGLENNNNKTKDFKKFLKELPPIITIDTFTFDRNMEQSISNYENIQYKGEIKMNIHGKGISNEEVEEISKLLGSKCLDESKLTPNSALKKINTTLVNIGNITQINTNNTNSLWELENIIEGISNNYEKLTNYKKTIKLFEIYRMLKDSNLCKK